MNKIFDFEVIETCLFLRKDKILVVGDLHLGYEEDLMRKGVLIPRNQFKETEEIFERIFEKTGKLKEIILLGDVKHVFGKILKQEFKDFEELVRLFEKNLLKSGKIIITKGNHDKILEKIVVKYPKVRLLDSYFLKDVLFLHGDKKSLDNLNKNSKILVFGHYHPSYILKDKKSVKQEKFKCFLYGFSKKYKKKVIFVPSFFPLIEGSDIINEINIFEKGMKLILIDSEGNSYDFGKLKL